MVPEIFTPVHLVAESSNQPMVELTGQTSTQVSLTSGLLQLLQMATYTQALMVQEFLNQLIMAQLGQTPMLVRHLFME
jgi:hypothetical protein